MHLGYPGKSPWHQLQEIIKTTVFADFPYPEVMALASD
jgi:hypothetical protein